jgi:DNA-binding transcriptional MerR regulator
MEHKEQDNQPHLQIDGLSDNKQQNLQKIVMAVLGLKTGPDGRGVVDSENNQLYEEGSSTIQDTIVDFLKQNPEFNPHTILDILNTSTDGQQTLLRQLHTSDVSVHKSIGELINHLSNTATPETVALKKTLTDLIHSLHIHQIKIIIDRCNKVQEQAKKSEPVPVPIPVLPAVPGVKDGIDPQQQQQLQQRLEKQLEEQKQKADEAQKKVVKLFGNIATALKDKMDILNKIMNNNRQFVQASMAAQPQQQPQPQEQKRSNDQVDKPPAQPAVEPPAQPAVEPPAQPAVEPPAQPAVEPPAQPEAPRVERPMESAFSSSSGNDEKKAKKNPKKKSPTTPPAKKPEFVLPMKDTRSVSGAG